MANDNRRGARVRVGIIAVLLLTGIASVLAQEAKPVPTIPSDKKAEIAIAERDDATIQAQMTQLDMQYQQLKQQLEQRKASADKKLADLQKEMEKAGYSFDMQTLTYTPNPAPAKKP